MNAMKMKMFKNEEEYNKAVGQLEKIGDCEDFEENEELIKQFELLSSLIEAYENENTNIHIGNPIEIIKLKMSYMGLKQKDLQPYIGSSGVVSEVLGRKRGLSKSMIRELSAFLHLDQNLLNTPYDLIESPRQTVKRRQGVVRPALNPLFKFADTAKTSVFKRHVQQRGALFAIGC